MHSIVAIPLVAMFAGGCCFFRSSDDEFEPSYDYEEIDRGPDRVEVPMHVLPSGNRAVDLIVGGNGGSARRFVLHTAAGMTRLGVKAARDAGCERPHLAPRERWGPLDKVHCSWPHINLNGFELSADAEPYPEDLAPLEVDGQLALNTLHGRAVTFDFRANRLIVERGAADAPETITTEKRWDAPGKRLLILLPVRTKARLLWFLIDSTRPGDTAVSPDAAAALGVQSGSDVTLDMGGIVPVRQRVVVEELDVDGVVGRSFLEAVLLKLDLGSPRAWISAYPNPPSSAVDH